MFTLYISLVISIAVSVAFLIVPGLIRILNSRRHKNLNRI